jgi:plastocyanin
MMQKWFQLARRPLLWAVMCLLAAAATACGGSSSTQQSASTSASKSASVSASGTEAPTGSSVAGASAATITIEGFSFGDPVTVSPGAQITVVNKDSVQHTVTSDIAGPFKTYIKGNSQETFTAPTAPGSYPFHCSAHPNMHGTLIVR